MIRHRWLLAGTVAILVAGAIVAVLVLRSNQGAPRQRIYLSVSGSDYSCVRNNAFKPCASFDGAAAIADGGDEIVVGAGHYPMTAPDEGSSFIDEHTAISRITFVCQGDGPVTFAAPVFAFHPGLSDVTFSGSCFHFHVPYFGFGGDNRVTRNITLNHVHMDSFDVLGARNITIENSTIGPFVACGAIDAPAYAACDPGSYWAQFPHGTDEAQQEPFIHSGAAGVATNIVLRHDHITGISSKWDGTHTGGLLVWDTDGLVITGSTFDHNAVYDVEFNAGSNDSNVTITNNHFGTPVYSWDPSGPTPGGPCVCDREIGIGVGSGATDTNWLVKGNTIEVGWMTDGIPGTTYRNVRIIDNVLGPQASCGDHHPGLVFSGNTATPGGRPICGG